jgi:hypothetical protein
MAASADALLLFVPVAGDAPASSVAEASARRPRLARPENDGGNDASADNQRPDAPDANRALRSRSADHKRAAEFPGGLAGTCKRVHQSSQHPLDAGAAGFLAVTGTVTPRMQRMRGFARHLAEQRKHSRRRATVASEPVVSIAKPTH